MKLYWQRFAARIDEMALRQRAMLFATVSLVVVVLAHVTLIEPVLIRQKSLIDRGNRDQSQLAAVRSQLESVLKDADTDPKDPGQAALRELEQRIAEVEQTLASRREAFIAPTRLPGLLKDLLGKNRQVTLESLRVVPGTPVEAPVASGQETTAAAAELYRHGVEMTLKGTYFELMQYVTDLEKLPARLLWGPVELQVEKYPQVRLTLQVHTLGTRRSLLTL